MSYSAFHVHYTLTDLLLCVQCALLIPKSVDRREHCHTAPSMYIILLLNLRFYMSSAFHVSKAQLSNLMHIVLQVLDSV